MTRKVLIVDDESVIRDILVDWLQEAGFETWTAGNGNEGLQQLQKHHPDLVISDVWMPEMDGYEFCETVRRDSDALIIMMTGVPREAKVLQEMKLDIDDYVIKPIDMVEFMRRIEAVLKTGRSSVRGVLGGATPATDFPVTARGISQPGEERLSEIYRNLSDENREWLEKVAQRLLDGD